MENPSLLARIPAKISIWWDKVGVRVSRRAPDDSSGAPIARKQKISTGRMVVTLMVISVMLATYAAMRNSRWGETWKGIGAINFGFLPQQEGIRQHGDFLRKDNPLYDLLPTGLDKKSCRSRFESALYGRGLSKKASPYLVSRLRRYEVQHKKCGPNTDPYNKTMEDLKLGRSPTGSDCRYVVWMPFLGLGNRIISLISSFLYALVTDRVLLVDPGFDLPDLFCEPFPETSWILPSDFPLANRFEEFHRESNESYGNKMRTNAFSNSTEPYIFAYLVDDYSDSDRLFYCNQDQMHLQNSPWVIIKSDIYFAPYLFLTPYFEQELNTLFPDEEAVFHLLSRYLLHPTNSAWGSITRYYLTYLSKADIKVGIQARVVDHGFSPLENVLDQILSCTIKENILPEINRTEQFVDAPSGKQKTVAVLVTSLNSIFSEEVRKKYLEYPTVTGELISVHQPTHEEHRQTDTQGHNKKAWIEMYLLSLMDKLVTSPGSTFGYVAQGLGGVRPWVLCRFEKPKIVPDPVCRRDESMEPCFFSPYYDCRLKRPANPAEFPHVKQCMDTFWGFKLVHSNDEL